MMSVTKAEEKKICSYCKFYADEVYDSPEGYVCHVCILILAKKSLERNENVVPS
jgi:hypothetical protein